MSKKRRLFLLDANALLHRAWHAIPPLTSPDGKVVNAVYGVLSVMLKLIDQEKPGAFVACWDTKAPTFRHEAFEAYKAQREKQPDELYEQIPWLKEGLALLGVPSVELDGYEADDLIGTLAMRGKKAGWDVVIVTGDRDALQMVQSGITVMAFKKGVSETITYDEKEVKREFGLSPKQFVEYKALRGDPSDNIPGVRGIGEKGATELLKNFKNLKGIFQAAHQNASDMSASTREKLLTAEKDVPAILKLVQIVTDVPVKFDIVARNTFPPDREKFVTFLQRFGFHSLLKRMGVGAEKKKESKEKFTKSKKNIGVNFHDVLVKAQHAGELILRVAQNAQASLFTSAIDGVALRVGEETNLIPLSLIQKDAMLKKEFAALLADVSLKKIAHDAKAEMTSLESVGFVVNGWSFDTMIAAYVLGAGERNHDLPAIALRYANTSLPEIPDPIKEVEAIAALVPVLMEAMKDEGLQKIFERFEMPLIPVLREMERQGILIDRNYLKTLSKEMTERRHALEKKMMALAGRPFNPASPSQLADVLFVDLQLPTKGIKRGKTGYSTAAPELEKLHDAHPIIELIDQHRELSKLLSTYVDVLPTLADAKGRVHTTFNQAVTATGRLSSSEPNLQNIPIRTEEGRKIRRAFIADPGCVLLSCDYSQIELRLVAALAKDEKMLEAFRRGEDIHRATAAAILGMKENEVTKDQRRAAKAINFGLIYGQGPQGLAISAGISFSDAKKFIATYFDVYHGIRDYLEETRTMAHKRGYVETLFGRRRPLPDIHSMMPQLRAAAERMAINMPVQGTAADLMKLAMIDVYQKLPALFPDARILLQVHDELVLEVRESEVAGVAAFVKDRMEHVEKLDVPIIVDAKAGKNWDEMTPLTL